MSKCVPMNTLSAAANKNGSGTANVGKKKMDERLMVCNITVLIIYLFRSIPF